MTIYIFVNKNKEYNYLLNIYLLHILDYKFKIYWQIVYWAPHGLENEEN